MSSVTKLLGDAGEHFALSMLSFSGRYAAKMPDNWKAYDLVVEHEGKLLRVSVKTRSQTKGWTFHSHYRFDLRDEVEWYVFLLKQNTGPVRAWVIPREIAVECATVTKESAKEPTRRRIPFKQLLAPPLAAYENNWTLDTSPVVPQAQKKRQRTTV